MPRLDLLRHLLTMAAADGSISTEELRLLASRALEWGISDDEFEQVLDEATETPVDLVLPEGRENRLALLKELVQMMAADGKLHEREKRLFSVVAAQMAVSTEELNQVIDAAIRDDRYPDADCNGD